MSPTPAPPPLPITPVAVAVIERPDGACLLARRPPGKPYAGYWEFPGGKVEPGESVAAALARELHEELGIAVTRADPWLVQTFAYPHATVALHFFRVRAWRGEPHGREAQEITWQRPEAVGVAPLLPANGPIFRALNLPPVMAISQAEALGPGEFLRRLEARLGGGLRLLQLREKTMRGDALAGLARRAVELAHAHGARVVINGEPELAGGVGADGVHLSAARLAARSERPGVVLCGASCHSRAELERAATLGLDYALLSPVKATLTHPETGPGGGVAPLGWEGFAALAHGLPLPVYALGGLTAGDLDAAQRHGAHGVVLLRAAWAEV